MKREILFRNDFWIHLKEIWIQHRFKVEVKLDLWRKPRKPRHHWTIDDKSMFLVFVNWTFDLKRVQHLFKIDVENGPASLIIFGMSLDGFWSHFEVTWTVANRLTCRLLRVSKFAVAFPWFSMVFRICCGFVWDLLKNISASMWLRLGYCRWAYVG